MSVQIYCKECEYTYISSVKEDEEIHRKRHARAKKYKQFIRPYVDLVFEQNSAWFKIQREVDLFEKIRLVHIVLKLKYCMYLQQSNFYRCMDIEKFIKDYALCNEDIKKQICDDASKECYDMLVQHYSL
ncbi:TPA: hypothetical protein ACGN07_005877 [Bacillus cereus]